MTPEVLDLTVILVAIAVGSCVQGAIGFGMGTVAAPVVALVDPSLLPGLIIVLALVLTSGVSLRERTAIDFAGVRAALAGRVVGVAAGTAVVVVLADRWIGVLVGVAVLASMGLSLAGWRPAASRRNEVVAGAASGLFGTTTAIGGPPMALVWRHGEHERARGTLAAYFVVGSAMSLAALLVAGQVDRDVLGTTLVALPATVVGFWLSEGALRWLTAHQIRLAGIAVSIVASLAAIVSGVLGG